MQRNNIYIPYIENKSIDYNIIIYLNILAEYNKEKKIFNIIKFNSIKQLCDNINIKYYEITGNTNNIISQSTLSRILNNNNYNVFFTYNQKEKEILLYNNFTSNKEHNKIKSFVVIERK